MSQGKLGEQLGVWNTYVGQIEKGDKAASDELCIKLAKVLKLDVMDLLLARYQARADSAEARKLFEKMRRAQADPALQQLLDAKEPIEPELLDILADADLSSALKEERWRKMLAGLYRQNKKRNVAGLMELVQKMGDKQWKGLVNVLEAMNMELPD